MTKKPSYRFEDYTESWEEKKLGEVNDVRDGTHDSPKYVQDGYPLVTSKNLTSEGLDFSDISFISEVDYISINKRSKVETGDIIFGMIGTIGNPVLLKIDGFAIKNVALLKKGGFIDNSFLIQLLQSSSFIKYISLENAGGTQKFLGLSQIRNFQLFSPSLPEQTTIGSFFQDIDQLISLQQRKLEVLKEQKKTYLKLLFPAKGQTKPALRFAGFEDEWKEVKLGEIGVTKSGVGFPDSEQGGVKGIPFYKVSDMNNIGNEIEMVTSNNYVTQEQIDSRKWKVIDTVPAIMFAKVGAALLLNRKRLIREPFLIDNNTMVYIPSVYWDVMFCKILFDTLNLSKYSQVGALPSYNGSDIEAIQVSIPSLPEQEAIGSFFQDLDKSIAKQEEKVNQLKESKQTLLRKMFI